jgi:hypothetical protein
MPSKYAGTTHWENLISILDHAANSAEAVAAARDIWSPATATQDLKDALDATERLADTTAHLRRALTAELLGEDE